MFDTLIQQQDYFWFLALVSQTAALLLGWRVPGEGGPGRWAQWVAGGNIVVAVAELVRLSQPVHMTPDRPWNLPIDLLLGLVLAVQTWGIWAPPGRYRRWLPALLLLLGLAWLRKDFPWSATAGLCALATLGLIRQGGRGPDRWLLLAALLTLWFSPIGPATGWLNNHLLRPEDSVMLANAPAGSQLTSLTIGLRRWSGTGSWGAWSSLLLFTAGLVFLTGRLRQPHERERKEWRRFGLLALLWLFAGLFLAALIGDRMRQAYEATALAGAKLAAGLLNPAELQRAFGPVYDPQPTGPGSNVAQVSSEFQAAVLPIRHHLALIEAASTTEVSAVLLVGRNGWNTIAAFADNKPYRASSVTLLGPAEEPDPAHPPVAEYRPPRQGRLGTITEARAPLYFPDGRFLGWLVLMADPENWTLGQAQARLQAFAIVGLGLGLAFMGLAQRLRGLARDEALRAAEIARQADQTKTEFLARVSHELRTPIQSVLGYGELLESSLKGEVARSRLAALRQHGQLMLRLVNDLLDLGALQSGRFRFSLNPTRVDELVRQTAESMRPRAEAKGLAYRIGISAATAGWQQADSERLRQIVLNLITNAIKFTDRGSVEVDLEKESDADFVLRVRDTGPGIPPGEAGRIFEAFVRLPETVAKEGMGLGLTLAHALCESMGGGIKAEDRQGGATFVARFRLEACAPPLTKERIAPRNLQGRKILIVDDNTLIRDLFSSGLRDWGAECDLAVDGPAALRLAAANRYDAVVLDLALPGMSGTEVARTLRLAGHTHLRIVGASAHASAEDRAQALAAGMDDFLAKPLQLGQLAAALEPSQGGATAAVPPPSGLDERLRGLFRQEAGALEAVLITAVEEKNWPVVQTKAHYLKNSADVLHLQALADACRDLGEAARNQDPAAAQAAMLAARDQLAVWR